VPLRWQGAAGPAGWALTGRAGGVSSGAPAGLNLGDHVGDDPGAVAENRARVARALPAGVHRLVHARQVHGRDVVEVGAADLPGPAGPADGAAPPTADALVTREAGVALAVVVADCVPVLLLDAAAVGVAHAGRRGMDLGVVPAAVAALRDLGAAAPVAVLGPSVCGRCYEVPEQMREDVSGRHPAARATTRRGRPALDVAAGVLAQLAALGVPAHRVAGCTAEDDGLFSVRRDGAATGRSAGIAWRLDAP
jgi:hypothetical protein